MESTLEVLVLEGLLLSQLESESSVHVACSDGVVAREVAERAGPTLAARGVSVGLIEGGNPVEGEASSSVYDAATSAWRPTERDAAYGCRIACGSVTALAFDYLRDSLPGAAPVQSSREVIVLLDAGRLQDEGETPLIIAAHAESAAEPDEAAREAAAVFERGRDYVVQTAPDGTATVVLLDKTGNPLPGRRWSNGIHEAIEAREGLPVTPPARAVAQTTRIDFAALYRRRVAVLPAGASSSLANAVRERWAADIVTMTEGE